jgi:hypothetical protein
MQALKLAHRHTSLQGGYMSLSRGMSWLNVKSQTAISWLNETSRPARSWLKEKSKSKPFRWIISVGQGMSLGSSLHDALTKILAISTLTGVAASVFVNITFGVVGVTIIATTLMTLYAISTNVKNMDEQGEQVQENKADVQELKEDNATNQKQFLNQQRYDIKLLEILIEMNADKPKFAFQIQQLLQDKINNYDPFGKPAHLHNKEDKQQNSLNSLYRAGSNSTMSPRRPDDNYHELIEITQSQQPASPSPRASQSFSNSSRFFSSPATTMQIPDTDVAIEIHANEDKHTSASRPLTPRAMGGSSV